MCHGGVWDPMRQDIESGCAADTGSLIEPAAVQPHGALLAVDATGCIASVAGATDRVFGRTPHDLLGSSLAGTAGPGRPLPAVPPDLTEHPRHVGSWLGDDRLRWDISTHRSGPYTLLEFEPAPGDDLDAATVAALHRACAAFERCADVKAACVAGAKALRHLTGYDRVTVERFAAGTVTVTAAIEGAIPGLPPSPGAVVPLPSTPDGEGLVHAVPDLAGPPAPLLPVRTDGGGPDLGRCVLRGIGAAQRASLESLGVAASLWLPIVVRGRPWGAVACHHSAPRAMPCALRLACELAVRELALRIDTCESDERHRQAGLLVQEANHRVQNSLQLVAAMLRVHARAAQAEVRSELEVAAGRLTAISAVHRQLSLPEGAQEVRLDAYLEQLCAELARSWGDAWTEHLAIDACSVSLAADNAISLGLVVTELLTNAVKYAYRGAPGPIGVHARVHGAWLHVTISDRGCGMHSDVAGTGLGSTLNRLFAAQLGGDIQLSSGDTGTTATLRVPLSPPRQDDAASRVGTG